MNPRLPFHMDLQTPRDIDTINSSDSSIPSHRPTCEAVWLKPWVCMPLTVLLSPAFPPCDTSLALPSNLFRLLFAQSSGSFTYTSPCKVFFQALNQFFNLLSKLQAQALCTVFQDQSHWCLTEEMCYFLSPKASALPPHEHHTIAHPYFPAH